MAFCIGNQKAPYPPAEKPRHIADPIREKLASLVQNLRLQSQHVPSVKLTEDLGDLDLIIGHLFELRHRCYELKADHRFLRDNILRLQSEIQCKEIDLHQVNISLQILLDAIDDRTGEDNG